MSIVKKFLGLGKKEPEITFEKLGITSEDGTLTRDGLELVAQYLFEKPEFRAEFAEKVAKPLLAQQEEESKK